MLLHSPHLLTLGTAHIPLNLPRSSHTARQYNNLIYTQCSRQGRYTPSFTLGQKRLNVVHRSLL